MTWTVVIALCLAALAATVWAAWRLGSRRRALPCPAWLHWMVELDNPFTRTNRAAEILAHLDLRPGMSILDVGCGPGRLALPAARAVAPDGIVVALDLQEGMLARAGERAQATGVGNIRFVQGDCTQAELDPASFDRALLVTVLGEIPDQGAALRAIHGALKPGGILSVTEIVFDPHFQGRAKVARLAAAAGFRERAFFGNRIAYTLHLEKPAG
ncbi:class I SAM-dependent methyltransferase [Marinibaculum pumilum]|uniref:Class I SAM-dependent methyltransferase n=1 Tax=Marinibaculum pumilum TaxID=1766165 RepID=A0ABV7L519_9PROT